MDRGDDAARDRLETLKGDTHDALDEGKERIEAGGEKVKRAVEGDSMPLGERIASHAKELGHEIKAEYDKSKRELRDKET
jgi:hypothetical protein